MKAEILTYLIELLSREAETLQRQQEIAREAATHEESRPENEHDTRSVEASYLAAGQAQRFETLCRHLALLKQFRLRGFSADEAISVGALVRLESAGKESSYFLLPVAGGYTVEWRGQTIHVVTPESLMGQALLDKSVGDEVELRAQVHRTFEIRSVA